MNSIAAGGETLCGDDIEATDKSLAHLRFSKREIAFLPPFFPAASELIHRRDRPLLASERCNQACAAP
jgi:hypothetical protein